MKTPKISIAIPTYECGGKGWLYTIELLNSIHKQSFTDYQVVISDQSTDEQIKQVCHLYSDKMRIKLVDGSDVKRSNSPNANNAIKHSDGELIKIMFMDDFFIDNDALMKIVHQMDLNDSHWLVNGSLHCNQSIHALYRHIIPSYNDNIHLGLNTISSPSVLTIREKTYFDENLAMLMDCEMYKRLHIKYGKFALVSDPLICNRIHENQMQNSLSDVLDREREYCYNLFKEREIT